MGSFGMEKYKREDVFRVFFFQIGNLCFKFSVSSMIFFKRYRNFMKYRFPRHFSNSEKRSWRRRTYQHFWKWEITKYPNVDICTVPTANIPKSFQKSQNTTTYWKPKEYWIQKYKPNRARFSHLAMQEARTHVSPSHIRLLQTCVVSSQCATI